MLFRLKRCTGSGCRSVDEIETAVCRARRPVRVPDELRRIDQIEGGELKVGIPSVRLRTARSREHVLTAKPRSFRPTTRRQMTVQSTI
jgi:hypothetical protein